jgi:DNA-binding transcriptional regulator YbjK
MPLNTERREQIADAALEVLATEGAYSLTHRAVDAHAGLPQGTTSNFFNSRQALFLAAGQRLAERHWAFVHALCREIGDPLDRRELVTILNKVMSVTGERRILHLARYELFLAGVRDASLQPILVELRQASLEIVVALLRSTQLPEPDHRVPLLSSLLNGLLFDSLTVPSMAAPLTDPEIVREIIDAVFDLPPVSRTFVTSAEHVDET